MKIAFLLLTVGSVALISRHWTPTLWTLSNYGLVAWLNRRSPAPLGRMILVSIAIAGITLTGWWLFLRTS